MRHWSVSQLNDANYCIMRYYLKKILKEPSIRLSVYAKGGFLHTTVEHFWEKHGDPHEVGKKKYDKKYSSPEQFTDYVKGKWSQFVMCDKKSKKPQDKKIAWRFEGEEWAIRNSFDKICPPLYKRLLEEGPPLYSELPFDYIINNIRFKGRIDEVRLKDGKVLIRDFKSGKSLFGGMKINHDPQLTLYNVSIGALCLGNKDFARSLGLEDRAKEFMGNPIYISSDFVQEFFMLESCETFETSRKDKDYFELLKMIKGTEETINSGNVYPEWGSKCDYCDMKIACEKKSSQPQNPCVDKKGNGLFDFIVPPLYARPIENSMPQGSFNFKNKKKIYVY